MSVPVHHFNGVRSVQDHVLDDFHCALSFVARDPEYPNVEGSSPFADGLQYLEIFRASPVFIFRDCEEFTSENLFYFWENVLPFLLHFFCSFLLLPLLFKLLPLLLKLLNDCIFLLDYCGVLYG